MAEFGGGLTASGGMATLDPAASPPPRGAPRRRYDPAWDDWNPPRRWPGILLSAVVVLGLLAVVIWHFSPTHKARQATQEKIVTNGQRPASPYVVGQSSGKGVITTPYHGRGDADIPLVSWGSLMILHAKCVCTFNFAVTIKNAQGLPVAVPINTSGTVGTVLDITEPPGAYEAAVLATGPWEVDVIQPQADAPTIATPFAYYSYGDDVLGPFSGANHYLDLQFLGEGDAISVQLMNDRGTVLGTLFAGRNFYERNRPIAAPPNPYYLLVTSGGYWSIDVRRSAPR